MVNSMTGFGSAQGQGGGYRWSIDIRSVNARGLDIRTRLPDGIDGLEKSVRERITKVAARGNVSVGLRLMRDEDQAALTPSEDKITAAFHAVQTVMAQAAEHGVTLSPPSPTDILSIRGVMESSRDNGPAGETLKALLEDFDSALESFRDMRKTEGEATKALLTDQVEKVDDLVDLAVVAAGNRTERMRTAIQTALETITTTTDIVDPTRVEAELAVIAVKADITEEIDRLRTHVSAAKDLLSSKGPIGRKLDFLTQEFNREANTLCSKAQSAKLTAIGLDLKAVIDQMREQVQNVE